MSDKLPTLNGLKSADLLVNTDTGIGKTVTQNGQKNTYIQNVDHLYINVPAPSNPAPIIGPNQPLNPNTDYYNLVISNMITISREKLDEKFSIEPKRALTEYIDDDVKELFASLSSDAIQKLQTFPTIFAHENTEYGTSTDPDQNAGFGYITKIKVRHDGFIIKPSILWFFKQQILNKNLMDFDIRGNDSFSELNRTHWTVKKVDIISEFRELGFKI